MDGWWRDRLDFFLLLPFFFFLIFETYTSILQEKEQWHGGSEFQKETKRCKIFTLEDEKLNPLEIQCWIVLQKKATWDFVDRFKINSKFKMNTVGPVLCFTQGGVGWGQGSCWPDGGWRWTKSESCAEWVLEKTEGVWGVEAVDKAGNIWMNITQGKEENEHPMGWRKIRKKQKIWQSKIGLGSKQCD